MRHLAPHLLADISRQGLKGGQLERAQEHLKSCERCSQALLRIEAGQVAMVDIAGTGAPELGWDHIAARVHWTTSSERRLQARKSRPRWVLPLVGSVSAAAIAGLSLWFLGSSSPASSRPASARIANTAKPSEVQPEAADESVDASADAQLTGVLSFAQGEVTLDGEPLDFDALLHVGMVVRTGLGRAVVQFGEQSAFRVAAQSQLQIKRFDRGRIELQIDGVVDVDITRRLAGQEFVVVAGGHEVVVRGTAFRVEYREGEIGVSCTRGEVVVTDGEGTVHVLAGQAFRVLSTAWNQAALRSLSIDGPELRALDKAMHMPMLPGWNEQAPLQGYSSVLEVQADKEQLVAVDGVAVSHGSFLLRSPSGRHQIAMMDEEGVLDSPQWIDLGDQEHASARIATPQTPQSQRHGASLRKTQLVEGLGKRPEACLKSLAKKGLAEGSYVVFEVGVNADGSQGFLNVVDSNLSPMIQRCFRDALDATALPAGPDATFRLKLDY